MEFGKVINTFTSKKGNYVTLRYPRKDDLSEMLRYVNELIKEDIYVLVSGKPITRDEEEKFLNDTIEQINKKQTVTLVVEIKGKIAGIAGVTREKYRKQHVGIPGISLAPEYREEGIGKIVFETLILESKRMGMRLLVLHCFENNVRALHLYKSLGFKKLGIIPGAVLFKGDYIGEVDMYLPLV